MPGEIPEIRMENVPSEQVWSGEIEGIEFGTLFTRNFFFMRNRLGDWQDAKVGPLTNFSIHPGATVFHYAQEIFEGLKAYRQGGGRLVLFRPDLNAARMNASARRLSMPEIPEDFFVRVCSNLAWTEQVNTPPCPGSLYLRPTMIGAGPFIKVSSSSEFWFYVLALATGPYFRGTTGADAGSVCVYVSQTVHRTTEGGTGSVKAGANYCGTLQVTEKAKKMGCGQVLFLDAKYGEYVEEMGGMNVFFVENGVLMTPPLSGTILPGITRDSLLILAREMGIEAVEQAISMDRIRTGIESGSITEAFACGTAAMITGIHRFVLENGQEIVFPDATPGPISSRLFSELRGIQQGSIEDRHGWIREVGPF